MPTAPLSEVSVGFLRVQMCACGGGRERPGHALDPLFSGFSMAGI